MERGLVPSQLVSKRVIGTTDAIGGAGRIDMVCGETEDPHQAGRRYTSEDPVEAGVMRGERRLQIFDLESGRR